MAVRVTRPGTLRLRRGRARGIGFFSLALAANTGLCPTPTAAALATTLSITGSLSPRDPLVDYGAINPKRAQ